MTKLYFKNRAEAGRYLAKDLSHYAKMNCAVVALSEGGVLVGEQIARKLHGSLSLLLTEKIMLPGESEAVAALSSAGTFTYNGMYSTGQLEEFNSEYRSYIEQQRLEKFHLLNLMSGKDGEVHRELLRHHVVILVSDGLNSGFSLDIATDFLKPIFTKKIIIATPIASLDAVDRMHILADSISCLRVVENYISTDHYYDDNSIPENDDLRGVMRDIILSWD